MAIVPVYSILERYYPSWPIHYPVYEHPTPYQPAHSVEYSAPRSIDRAVFYSIHNPGNFWIWGPDQ